MYNIFFLSFYTF